MSETGVDDVSRGDERRQWWGHSTPLMMAPLQREVLRLPSGPASPREVLGVKTVTEMTTFLASSGNVSVRQKGALGSPSHGDLSL